MRLYKKNHIFKSHIKDHKAINAKILQLIDNAKKNLSYVHPTITSTDWEDKSNSVKEYFKPIEEHVMQHMQSMAKYYKVKAAEVDEIWFQQYEKSSSHKWHVHPRCHFSNVYYVECPKTQGIKFTNFEIPVEVGDLISFPSFLPHMSPKIRANRKSIISFNSQFNEA